MLNVLFKSKINFISINLVICLQQPSRVKGDIGHYTDGNSAPLVHCVRLLSASFLLTGEKGGKFL